MTKRERKRKREGETDLIQRFVVMTSSGISTNLKNLQSECVSVNGFGRWN